MARRTIGIHEKLPILESLPLSFQYLTAMFGATIFIAFVLSIWKAWSDKQRRIGSFNIQ